MTATQTRAPVRTNGHVTKPPTGLSRRRAVQLPYLGLGILLMVVGAIAFGLWGSSSTASTRLVLAAAHDIAPGAVITRGDLRSVRVSVGSDASVVPTSDLDGLVGKRAAVAIPSGALLSSGSVRAGAEVQQGEAIVSVLLAPGTAPVPDLQVGDRVAVVAASTGKTGASGTAGVLATADVVGVTPQRQGGSTTGTIAVSLRVPVASAASIADAAAAQRVSLVLIAPDEAFDTQSSGH